METVVNRRKGGILACFGVALVSLMLIGPSAQGATDKEKAAPTSEDPAGKVELKSPSRGISSVIGDEPAWYSRPDAFPQPRIPDATPRAKPPSEPRSSWKPNYYYPSMWD